MNSNNNGTTRRGGIGFCGLLTIVFIILKLVGVIKWSWLWVFMGIGSIMDTISNNDSNFFIVSSD